MDSSIPRLFDCDLEQLRFRLSELDSYEQAVERSDPDIDFIYASVFSRGGTDEDDWNNYHRVRSEYDRRAAEEFGLGQ
jgi:alkanesulfonate monooxygenase SsuD/methylene tetrahydromethanopterin reductase-like flavin-dependent oxidoreductase (luciferase family)